MEQIKAEKSQFVTIIATNGGQFRPRLRLLAAKSASGGDDEPRFAAILSSSAPSIRLARETGKAWRQEKMGI